MSAVLPDELPEATKIELWWQDEMRLGQKNGTVRQWARKGTRPRQPADQRYESAYVFGAICPGRGIGAAIVLPRADTGAMQEHLDEIARHVAEGSHAVILMDRASWHTTDRLRVPQNISILFLPPKSPELTRWRTYGSTCARIGSPIGFETYDNILTAACDAWNNLLEAPETITSIGTRNWAKNGQGI